MKDTAISTRIPPDLARLLDAVAQRTGLKKTFIIEAALREKLEDLLDAEDLRGAIGEASGFHRWEDVKREASSRRDVRRRA
jgi:predicted transcriptional regulator